MTMHEAAELGCEELTLEELRAARASAAAWPIGADPLLFRAPGGQACPGLAAVEARLQKEVEVVEEGSRFASTTEARVFNGVYGQLTRAVGIYVYGLDEEEEREAILGMFDQAITRKEKEGKDDS